MAGVAARTLATAALSLLMTAGARAYLDIGAPGDQLVCGTASFNSDTEKLARWAARECKAGDVIFMMRFDNGREPLSQELPAILCDFGAAIVQGVGGRSLICVYRGNPRGERHTNEP